MDEAACCREFERHDVARQRRRDRHMARLLRQVRVEEEALATQHRALQPDIMPPLTDVSMLIPSGGQLTIAPASAWTLLARLERKR